MSFRFLISGHDTIEVCYYLRPRSGCMLDYQEIGLQKEALRHAKHREPKIIELGGESFLLKSYGSSNGFPLVMENATYMVEFGEFNHPSFRVKFRSQPLWEHGALVLHQRFLHWADEVGLYALKPESLSRVDFTFDYLLPEIPALPAFSLQRAVSTMIRDLGQDYWTGTVYTTNRRVWEHDDVFKEYLGKTRCMAIDMETATIFAAGFANSIPAGALLLVSDQPMVAEGVKTEDSDRRVTDDFVERHIKIGVEALRLIRRHGKSVKHLRFDD